MTARIQRFGWCSCSTPATTAMEKVGSPLCSLALNEIEALILSNHVQSSRESGTRFAKLRDEAGHAELATPNGNGCWIFPLLPRIYIACVRLA